MRSRTVAGEGRFWDGSVGLKEHQRYYYCRRRVLEVLSKRGYHVPSSEINLSPLDFNQRYGFDYKLKLDLLHSSFSLLSCPANKVFVFFCGPQPFTLSVLSGIPPKIRHKKRFRSLILILHNQITNAAQEAMSSWLLKVEILYMNDLLTKTVEHYLKPIHIVQMPRKKHKHLQSCNSKATQGKTQQSLPNTPIKTPTEGCRTEHASLPLKRKQSKPKTMARQPTITSRVDEVILAELSPTIPSEPTKNGINKSLTEIDGTDEEVWLRNVDDMSNLICLAPKLKPKGKAHQSFSDTPIKTPSVTPFRTPKVNYYTSKQPQPETLACQPSFSSRVDEVLLVGSLHAIPSEPTNIGPNKVATETDDTDEDIWLQNVDDVSNLICLAQKRLQKYLNCCKDLRHHHKTPKGKAQQSLSNASIKTPSVPPFRTLTEGCSTEHASLPLKRKQPQPETLATQPLISSRVDEVTLVESLPTVPSEPANTALNRTTTEIDDTEEDVWLRNVDDVSNLICLAPKHPQKGCRTEHASLCLKRKQPEPKTMTRQPSITNRVDEVILVESSPIFSPKPTNNGLNKGATEIHDTDEEAWLQNVDDVSNLIRLAPKLQQKRQKQMSLVVSTKKKQRPLIVSSKKKQIPIVFSKTKKQMPLILSKRKKQIPLEASSTVAQVLVEDVPVKEVEAQATERDIGKGRGTFRRSGESLTLRPLSSSFLVPVELQQTPAESEPSSIVLDSQTSFIIEPSVAEDSAPSSSLEKEPLNIKSIQPVLLSAAHIDFSFVTEAGTSRGSFPVDCCSKIIPLDNSLDSSSSVTSITAPELYFSQLFERLRSMKEQVNSLHEAVHPSMVNMKAKVKELLRNMQTDPQRFQSFDALVDSLRSLAQLVPAAHCPSVESLKGMVEMVQVVVRTFHEKEEFLHTQVKDVPQVHSQINELFGKAQLASSKVESIEAERAKALDSCRLLEAQIAELQAQLSGVETRINIHDLELFPARNYLEETRHKITTNLPRFDEQFNTSKHTRAVLDNLMFDINFYAKSALDYSLFLDLVK